MHERVPAVGLGEHETGAHAGLLRRQLCLVVRVRLGVAAPDRGEHRRHPGRGKVLYLAVESVQTGVLADLGHVQVPDGTKAVGDHGKTVTAIASEGPVAWLA